MQVPALDEKGAAPYAPQGGDLLAKWSERRQQALSDRRKYEPVWRICVQFLAGRQWVGRAGEGRNGRVMDRPNPQKREQHTVNVITARVETVKGKLFVEDLRPTIVFTRDDVESENITTHTRSLAKYVWDTEVAADKKLEALFTRLLT